MYCSGTNNLFSNLSSKNINPLAAKSSHHDGILGPLYESRNFHTFFSADDECVQICVQRIKRRLGSKMQNLSSLLTGRNDVLSKQSERS